jgi:hypothetical protein
MLRRPELTSISCERGKRIPMIEHKVREEDFSVYSWCATIPMTDDVYLSMQAQNIAVVDMTILRHLEAQALEEFFSQEDRISQQTLSVLSALSQMWVFALYEFLRTWRQRARALLGFAEKLAKLADDDEREAYMKDINEGVRSKARLVKLAPVFYYDHVAKLSDNRFIAAIREYKAKTDDLFREVEAIRIALAKHEVAGKEKLFAEAPGYGGVNKLTGSMYWQIVLAEDVVTIIERRELANKFLGIVSMNEEGEAHRQEPKRRRRPQKGPAWR